MDRMLPLMLTLDYEMFNGIKSGSVQNCMIIPTEELLKVIEPYNFHATFFVDTCFLLRLKKESFINRDLKKDYDSIVNQLKELAKKGHDLELHIHPNWYHATYDGNWHAVVDDYKLSDMTPNEVEDMFREGIALLQEIKGSSVIAFRAGAYCIQTLENYSSLFKKYGLRCDSSVNRYQKEITEKWAYFDYTRIPKEYSYSFSTDVTQKDEKGELFEVSIPTYKMNWISSQIASFRSFFLHSNSWGDGSGSRGGSLLPLHKRYLKRIQRHLKNGYASASIDNLGQDYSCLFRRELKKNGQYMLLMGHPKCFSPLLLKKFDEFLSKYRGHYENMTIADYVNCYCTKK